MPSTTARLSGAVTDRKALAKAVATLREGDVLLVTRLDRLTRSILNVLAGISEKGAGLRSLADLMIDATNPHRKLIIAVLGALVPLHSDFDWLSRGSK
jgi:DNA invertase Pin-like site-specific DNA recombinase